MKDQGGRKLIWTASVIPVRKETALLAMAMFTWVLRGKLESFTREIKMQTYHLILLLVEIIYGQVKSGV